MVLCPNWLDVTGIIFRNGHRESAATPSFITFRERADSSDSFAAKQKREPSGRDFIGASTKQDDLAVARNNFVGFFKLRRVHVQSPRNCLRLCVEIERMPQVEDDEVLAGVDFFLEFFRGDAGNFQPAQESFPVIEFPANVPPKS